MLMLSLALSACRCGQQLQPLAPSRLVLAPQHLSLGAVYVGQVATAVVSVLNEGGAPVEADVVVEDPFTVTPDRLRVTRGEVAEVIVSFAPLQPGLVSGVLVVGGLELQVEAEAVQVPACVASNVCLDASFDVTGARCVESTRANGTACETRCVMGGCNAGTCVGQLKGCDDANACTIDACDEVAGCRHSPRVCPEPTAPCRVARCDLATGCATEEAPDGTLCGPDDCLTSRVDVCISGACVTRVRPDTGRCANTWAKASVTARSGHAMAFDDARQRLVLFGGSTADTWVLDGAIWTQRFPAASPPARDGHAMAYDAARQRVVLFGGSDLGGALADTWEWDGATWTQRFPAASPPARFDTALAYDAARRRVILFGGNADLAGTRSDTWEWDGTTWTQGSPATSPPARSEHALAYDAARQRVVLFGGYDGNNDLFGTFSDTWEWDGVTWTRRFPAASPPARGRHAIAYDATRQRVVVFGGADHGGGGFDDTWEWDGTSWTQRSAVPSPPSRFLHALAYDGARQRVVLFGGFSFVDSHLLSDTWEWGGTSWVQRSPSPPGRESHALASDIARQRIVLFGGGSGGYFLGDTWEWDGALWTQRFPSASPPARVWHALASDAARRRVVLFGGWTGVSYVRDTWEWDGATWTQRFPAASPPARANHSLAYDSARQRVVLFGGTSQGGGTLSDTWEWDGSTWTQRSSSPSPPARCQHALAYDSARQRVVLFGGHDANGLLSDTWEWDGTTWTQSSPVTSPPARFLHALAWDSMRRTVVLFGGGEPTFLSDTWDWNGTTWTQRFPVVSPPRQRTESTALAYDLARQRLTLFTGTDTWVFLP